ncbi:beta-ketoacyl synthase N-terminal-like domain-containing protein [Streptomyces sp. NPDC017520]|uniref:beta-ketoacyl synthase N-terminal-like domain-containing protein n=1 Tax=Streptomyces sp. NPDC017520 TaxID=3364998 RepID=UPI00378E169F
MTSLLGLDDLDLSRTDSDDEVRITRSGAERTTAPVAIVGMSGRAGEAANLDEFWSMILHGGEGYRALSKERCADIDAFLTARGAPLPETDERYIGGTRMPSVAEFDHRFFSLSPLEAKTIDPHQRIFLETSWAALEDSGYLSKEIRGEKVGVYVGMSADFGMAYRAIVQGIAPDAPEIAVAGNIASIIGSRLAYLLDLRGPSMLVDTACSSGLTAVYTACRAIQAGECTMALAGAVNCDLLPLVADESGIGIKYIRDNAAADGRTRTFDRRSDGTSAAEGCFAFVLKDLDLARRDGDTIHAVIMGGAVNQDGASNGITAPNVAAQADLIEAAQTDAGVTADQISFIEAHGTATKLGDPAEIGGIERAFARQTSRRQFCGIGTVKTNIGHMDNASGLAGLAKLVLSLRHRTLPASLHFAEPNPNINFPQSPVYVNDRTVPWPGDEQETLYAGISSFGLSGTNCHLIVRSADPAPAREAFRQASECFLLPLSAPDPRGLGRLARLYRDFVLSADVEPSDVAFTASIGRLHHRCRAAFVFENLQELAGHLSEFVDAAGAPGVGDDVSRGDFRVVLDQSEKRDAHDVTESERVKLDREAAALVAGADTGRGLVRRLASLYTRGAEIDWRAAASEGARRVPLPTYPFERTRCWIEADRTSARSGGLPAAADVVHMWDRDVVIHRLRPDDHWELAEHRVHGVSVLPGTGLVEMIVAAAQRRGRSSAGLTLRNVVFETPLAVPDGDEAEVHVIITGDDGVADAVITSRTAHGTWVRNARAELALADPGPGGLLPVDDVRRRLNRPIREPEGPDRTKGLEAGEHWNVSLHDALTDDESAEILYDLELPERYQDEIGDYVLHPALFDALINAPSNHDDDERLYLPFSYGSLTVHGPLPARVVAHFRKRPESIPGRLYAFDVRVADADGHVALTVDNYCLMSAADLDLGDSSAYGYVQEYRRTTRRPAASPSGGGTDAVLLCGDFGDASDGLVSAVEAAGYTPVRVAESAVGDPDEPLGGVSEFAFALLSSVPAADTSLAEQVAGPVDRAVAMLGRIAQAKPVVHGHLVVVTRDALAVTGDEADLDPGQAGVLGAMRVAALEYTSLRIRCVDSDGHTAPETLVAEAAATDRPPFVLYRGGQPYEPTMSRHVLAAESPSSPVAAADGVVVVSGGTGDLGTAVTEYLVGRGARRVVLLGSPGTDTERAEWERWSGELDAFEVLRVDLGERSAVLNAVDGVRRRHGRISGVLHLAGRPGSGFLYTKSAEQFAGVYRPKALGGVYLHEATRADDLDFFVTFSSISGLDLAPGQTDYTAANLVLDSLAQYRRLHGLPAVSVQWPAWRETGMAWRLGAVEEEGRFLPLDTGEALDVFGALLARADHPAVLMPGRMRAAGPASRPATQRGPSATSTRTVTLHGLDTVGDVERSVAEIWGATLDITEFDAFENFGELGGNSLLTSQMFKHYDERYPGIMDITDLFRYTTIADQAAYIRSRRDVGDAGAGESQPEIRSDSDSIDQLLDMLTEGTLSVEESKDLL